MRTIMRTLVVIGTVALVAAACGGGAQPGATTAPAATQAATAAPTVAAFKPTRPSEFVISTGPGGSSDIYARLWISYMEKDKLTETAVTPVNKEGGGGAVAFTYVFEKKGDPHYLMVTLNTFWTTTITQKLPYKTTDFTPIANMANDPFFLWVNADSPIKTAGDFIKEAQTREMTASGTASKAEDEVMFRRIEDLAKTKVFKYVPQTGGGAVATALAGKQGGVEVTVNNPSEARALAQQGKVRAICSFTPTSPAEGQFKDLPTCKSQGLAIDDYYNVRSVMAAPGLTAAQQAYWVGVFQKINDSADWKKFVSDNALISDFQSGDAMKALVEKYQKLHEEIATKFKWIN